MQYASSTHSNQFFRLAGPLALCASLCAFGSGCTSKHQFDLLSVKSSFVAATQRGHDESFVAAMEKSDQRAFTAAIEGTSKTDFVAARGEDKNLAPFSTTIGEDRSQAAPAARQKTQKVDLLWVVDNSASMEPNQEKLRKGFAKFAAKYMRPNWDIRVAAITTDTYLANPAYREYVNKPNPGYSQKSSYLRDELTKLGSSASALLPLFDVASGSFASNPAPKDIFPKLGQDYARLLPGNHDGPIPILCYDGRYEKNGNPFTSSVDCKSREALVQRDGKFVFRNSGVSACVNPTGRDAISGCVNTALNDTIHSGKPIISTLLPEGQDEAAWSRQLLQDFIINVSVSTGGSGSERGMSSVLQLLDDNEKTETRFFRADSKRLIVFLSDEDDGSIHLENAPAGLEPESKLAPKTRIFGGREYTYDKYPRDEDLIAVSEVKDRLDRFFMALDGRNDSPNYAVEAIVVKELATLNRLYKKGSSLFTQDMGTRYMALAKLVGNGSDSMDIGAEDYSPLLDRIGTTVSEGFRIFTLESVPTAGEKLIVKIVRKGKQDLVLAPAQYKLEGKTLTILDDSIVNDLQASDQLVISYEAKRLNTFTLERAPGPGENVTVQIKHVTGKVETLSANQYQIQVTKLTITDAAVVKGLQPGDQLIVQYSATRETTFSLQRAPDTDETVTVTIVHVTEPKTEVLKPSQYKLEGTTLRITDTSVTQRFVNSDKVLVTYDLHRVPFFQLDEAPETDAEVTVTVVHADGSKSEELRPQTKDGPPAQYIRSGARFDIVDKELAKRLKPADKINVRYYLHRVNAFALPESLFKELDPDARISVTLLHADGTSEKLKSKRNGDDVSQYEINGLHLEITDEALKKRLKQEDQVKIHYQLNKLNEYDLPRKPNSKAEMIAKVSWPDGSEQVLKPEQFDLDGSKLIITDKSLAESLKERNGRILVNYQPKSVFE